MQTTYGTTKQYLCCDVPGLLQKMYIVLTAVGWLAMVTSVVSFVQLYYLDRIPMRACCPCSAMRPYNPFGQSKEEEYGVKGKQVDEEAPPTAEMTMDRGGIGKGGPIVG